ncbi:MAG: PilW family protein [Chromatiaceae bacterium]
MVELLIAMAVGLFLMGGILQMFVASKASYRLGEAEARAQENGRFATQMIAADLRAARGTGCRSMVLDVAQKSLSVVACDLLDPQGGQTGCAGDPAIGPDRPLGYASSQGGTTGWLAGLSGTDTDGTFGAEYAVGQQWLRGDVIVTWGADGEGVYAALPLPSQESDRARPVELVDADRDLTGGRLALISDCEATDIFAITNPRTCQGGDLPAPTSLQHAVTYDGDGSPDGCDSDQAGNQANVSGVLSRAYNRMGSDSSPGATLRARAFPFEYSVYYVCCIDNRDGAVQGGGNRANCTSAPDRYRPGLCRWSTSTIPRAQSLVSDVADLRVIYDGDADPVSGTRFLDLDGVTPDAAWVSQQGYWDRVDSARIQILSTAAEEVRTEAALPAPEASDPGDLGYRLPADRRIYQSFDVTVAIRASSPWFVQQ